MEKPALPLCEAERLLALRSYAILDTSPEPAFDDIARLAAHILDVPIALVSLVDSDRHWFKARYGIEVFEGLRDESFCGHVVASTEPLIVPDATRDPRFADSPVVLGEPHVRFTAECRCARAMVT